MVVVVVVFFFFFFDGPVRRGVDVGTGGRSIKNIYLTGISGGKLEEVALKIPSQKAKFGTNCFLVNAREKRLAYKSFVVGYKL